jgi:glycerol-3-phosphate dehydrogenase
VFNSERLVLAFLLTAREHGADVFNYLGCKNYLIESGRIRGVLAEDALSGRQLELIGDQVIDCTGPWAVHNQLFQELIQPMAGKTQARACNILIRRRLSDYALGFLSKPVHHNAGFQTGSRLLFIAPWRDGSLVGTWYYADNSSPAAAGVSREELQAALKDIDSALPSLQLTLDDISFVHCGLLPVTDANEGLGEPLLQKHFQLINAHQQGGPAGLFWVQGVKYTTARAIADYALQQVARAGGKSLKPAVSDKTPLYGGYPWRSSSARLSEATVQRLLKNYGSCTEQILHYIEREPALAEPIPGVADSVQAELQFVLDHEMVYTLSDLLLRRTDIGSLAKPAAETINFCCELMALRFSWNSGLQQLNINDLLARYPKRMLNVRPQTESPPSTQSPL